MAGDILLLPSPNWFLIDAMDCRAEDHLLASASYKLIVIQQLLPGQKLPTLLKVIPNQSERVHCVRLCPLASEPVYGHTVASVCEGSVVRLFNLHTGDIIAEHSEHKGVSVNGICWGRVGEEEVVVTVAGGGQVVVWQPQHNAAHLHTLPQYPELTVVEVNPLDRSQALVAANRDIALMSLKTGRVQTWLKGHDMNIYCMRWYPGEESPLTEDMPINSRAEAMMEGSSRGSEDRKKASSWRQNGERGGGPFFASSDYGRNIYIWDVSAKRYVAKITVPISAAGYKRHMVGKDKGGKVKHHVPLAWYKKQLLSSTVHGELLQWLSLQGKGKYKAVHHLHNRAIYNLLVVDNVVVTSGQDRVLQGFDVAKAAHVFQQPVLGGFATTLAFCPSDASRLAIGSVDNTLRLIKFGSPTPLQCLTMSQNIKGKILSLAWHPEQESHLLFGTGTGQVGWIDVSNCHMTTFAYYHQKCTYKVQWAPPVCSQTSGIPESGTWYAYSFGDREIVMRSPSSPLADPINLKNLVPDPENKFPKDITEFSFSPDFNFLTVGLNDGQIMLYRRHDLQLVATVVVVKKAVQHLLWKPQTETCHSYTLAVGSNENKIHTFCLENYLKRQEDKTSESSSSVVLVTQATRVLSGHEARVVWLSWSPHRPSVLASASYDHTVQLWDVDSGTMLGNYGGHMSRVFRVEFSPSDPDLLYSCAEENAVHFWRPSKLTCKTPAESCALLKEYQCKKEQRAASWQETTATQEVTQKNSVRVESEAGTTSTTTTTTTTSTARATCTSDSTKKNSDSGKKTALKSFFPKLHSVSSRKKGFHHLVLLSMLALRETQQDLISPQQKETDPVDDLEDLDDIQEEEEQEIDSSPIIVNTTEKYSFLLEEGSEMAALEDFLYVMQMYGQPHQMDAILAAEIETHDTKGNSGQATMMHCWRGSLCNHIRLAAKQKKLTPFLVASAPQVSMKLWETSCEAYAEQLLAEGDVITAASYLLNIHKVEEAIDILLQHRYFREAMAIAKSRLGYSQDQLRKVVDRWTASATLEGNMDLAATLQLSVGEVEAAARSLSRRTDPGSLFVSARLYAAAGNEELSMSSGVMALKEASIKQEMEKVEAFICNLPKLKWFRVISCLHSLLLKVIQQEGTGHYSYLVNVPESGGEAAARGRTCLVEEVQRQWLIQGFSQDQHQDLYQHIVAHFSTQQMPSYVKQLWFFVSVALCQCLLAPSRQLWDQHLRAALRYAAAWGKPDQLLHLTHALLPRGKNDIEVLKSSMPEAMEGEKVASPGLHVLWQLYQQAEVALLHSFLMSDDSLSRLQENTEIETELHENVSNSSDITVTTPINDGGTESKSYDCISGTSGAAAPLVPETVPQSKKSCGYSSGTTVTTTAAGDGLPDSEPVESSICASGTTVTTAAAGDRLPDSESVESSICASDTTDTTAAAGDGLSESVESSIRASDTTVTTAAAGDGLAELESVESSIRASDTTVTTAAAGDGLAELESVESSIRASDATVTTAAAGDGLPDSESVESSICASDTTVTTAAAGDGLTESESVESSICASDTTVTTAAAGDGLPDSESVESSIRASDTTVTSALGDGMPESGSGAHISGTIVTTAARDGVPLCVEGETSFSFPLSMADLRASLSFYLENIDSDSRNVLEKLEVAADGLENPWSLLEKIIVLLNEKGCLNPADVESFLSRFPSHCDFVSSSVT